MVDETAAQRYGLSPTGSSSAQLLADVDLADTPRLTSGFDEFDRVLGGGIVPGSVVLLGGEPGIGKSTLLLQAAARVAHSIGPVLYASGEESEHQIKARGDRLGIGDAPLYLLAETCLERILDEVRRLNPALLIVDSIQTMFSLKLQSAPGSIGQGSGGGNASAVHRKGCQSPDLSCRAHHEGRKSGRPKGP